MDIFLPGSGIMFHLDWRNVKTVDFALFRADMIRDFEILNHNLQWVDSIDLSNREKIRTWSMETGDSGNHQPGQKAEFIEGTLPVGAYVLEATSAEKLRDRELILVSDTALVVKTMPDQTLLYFCDALKGAPIPRANVTLWKSGNRQKWERINSQTDQSGTALLDLHEASQFYAVAESNGRLAFASGQPSYYGTRPETWRIYAFADRPAYRPNEEVHWKFIARQFNGSIYSIPSNQTILFEIKDPFQAKVQEGKAVLNAFGSAWGSLRLSQSLPLGNYTVTFWDQQHKSYLGSAMLFRLEEYKLPEFKARIELPEENGNPKTFRTGEKVHVTVHAEYYFGGPVRKAVVELLVYQNAFSHSWNPPRQYPWYYEEPTRWYGRVSDDAVAHSIQKTDTHGQATFNFDTPPHAEQDFEYEIEARITDASRREVVVSDFVRVTRQAYFVHLSPEHSIHLPQEKATVEIKSIDANNRPVTVSGAVRITKDRWYEVWLDPEGKEVTGEKLKRAREKYGRFPPIPDDPQKKPWQLKFQGYHHEELLSDAVKTNASGEAKISFAPDREGYYRIRWDSVDEGGWKIESETTIWVAGKESMELDYHKGALEIILDRDTVRAGKKVPVLLSVPANDRYVLFTVEGEGIHEYRLVHLQGTETVIEVEIPEKYSPNVFFCAAMVTNLGVQFDRKEVMAPPAKHFLQVEVKADREEYRSPAEGTLTVTTRDQDGNPVSAEVALGLIDEAVYSFQSDYAQDPREFYFGQKRYLRVRTESTFEKKRYVKLIQYEPNKWKDQRILAREKLGALPAGRGIRNGTVYGKVMDNRGIALPGVSVVLEHDGVPVRTIVTSADGGFVMDNIPPGIYSIDFQLTGYSEIRQENVAVISGGKVELHIVTLPSLAEHMIVTAETAVIDTSATTAGMMPESGITVRSDFRSTAFWKPDVVTGEDGTAVIPVKYPDSLTGWKATARAVTQESAFGIAFTDTRTTKPLIVRLQAPRFFVVGDRVTVSAVINNTTAEPFQVTAALNAEGLLLEGAGIAADQIIEAHGHTRADWVLSATTIGPAKLRVSAHSTQYADAMERTFPVFEHGVEKFVSRSGKMSGNDVIIKLDLPRQRRPESTSLSIQLTPSIAVTMLDALPYLIEYPYGCTEQTMSRFLPAVITRKTLKDLELNGNSTGLRELPHAKERKDFVELDRVVEAGLSLLYHSQHSDGGWGWWPEGETDDFMTAYVVWGMVLARQAGIEVEEHRLMKGIEYLCEKLVEYEENADLQVWILHPLSEFHTSQRAEERKAGEFERKAYGNLWNKRSELNAYSRALLALSAHHYGHEDQASTLVKNLRNGVKIDSAPDTSVLIRGPAASTATMATAHWGPDQIFWRWADGPIEATSFALRAMLAVDPQNELIEPVVNWLVKNRRGAQWNNTRDTAIAVLALNDYLRKSRELDADLQYELRVNGHLTATERITPENLLQAPSVFSIEPQHIRDGINEIHILKKSGNAPLYFSAQAKFFSLEEPVTPAGNEIFVRRQYESLIGKDTLLKGYIYKRKPVTEGEPLDGGNRIEAVITVDAKNDYEYLVFEDLKPAGFEAVEMRSGEPLHARELKPGGNRGYAGRACRIYQELRDRKVVSSIDRLPEGLWEIRYELRAETPGSFHALPILGHAMYVPEIRSNGAETMVWIRENLGAE